MPKKAKLPTKPSKLIRVALADLYKVERDKRYAVDMRDWHRPVGSLDPTNCPVAPRCEVCLAGAVIAKTLLGNPSERLTPEDFKGEARALNALEHLRIGLVFNACRTLKLTKNMSIVCRDELFRKEEAILEGRFIFPRYRQNPLKFKAAMRRMANFLEKRGL